MPNMSNINCPSRSMYYLHHTAITNIKEINDILKFTEFTMTFSMMWYDPLAAAELAAKGHVNDLFQPKLIPYTQVGQIDWVAKYTRYKASSSHLLIRNSAMYGS